MWCTPYIEFFNSENYGKRALHPLETATPKRQRQNTDFPESKALLSELSGKRRLKWNVGDGQSRCS